MSEQTAPIVVCAMYKFVTLENFQELRQPLLDVMEANEVRGTLLIAQEGINGTVAGSREGIDTGSYATGFAQSTRSECHSTSSVQVISCDQGTANGSHDARFA